MNRKHVLVTGSHRSGTTWVGKTLARYNDTLYVNEPFNPTIGREDEGLIPVFTDKWFEFVETSDDEILNSFENLMQLNYDLKRSLRNCSSHRAKVSVLKRAIKLQYLKRTEFRLLIKDPIALFSAPWLHSTFDLAVVTLIRHPAAFVSSIMRLGWSFPFTDWVSQPRLMSRLGKYAEQVEDATEQPKPLIDQACLLWNCFHATIAEYQNRFPDWCFIRHEDLSSNPTLEFRNLHRRLGIPFTEASVKEILKSSTSPRVSPDPINPFCTSMNSKQVITRWKDELSIGQIEEIYSQTEAEASNFYEDNEW